MIQITAESIFITFGFGLLVFFIGFFFGKTFRDKEHKKHLLEQNINSFELAMTYYKGGEFFKALKYLHQIEKIQEYINVKKDPRILLLLGLIYSKLKATYYEREIYEEIAYINKDPYFYYLASFSYFDEGNMELAFSRIQKAIKLEEADSELDLDTLLSCFVLRVLISNKLIIKRHNEYSNETLGSLIMNDIEWIQQYSAPNSLFIKIANDYKCNRDISEHFYSSFKKLKYDYEKIIYAALFK